MVGGVATKSEAGTTVGARGEFQDEWMLMGSR